MTVVKPLRSIKTRLVLLVALSVALANVVVVCLSLWQESSRYAAVKHESLFATAQTLAAAAARATSTHDATGVYEAIRAIGRITGISYVAVSDENNQQIADLGATEQLIGDIVSDENADTFSVFELLASRSVEISVPIIYGGRSVGRLRLLADTSDMSGHLQDSLTRTLIGLGLALSVGLAVALGMQRTITKPLTDLTNTMARVSTAHDYGVSLPAQGDDEVGILVSSFNAMIGEIRHRDERLSRHREHLEHEVEQRTQDLRAAKDAAEMANSQKSDFLATMSHEIRTPMNGMLVMAELLANGDLPPRSRRYAEVIARSGQSLLAIINDILDLSKVEAGKLELEKIEVDPVEVATTVIDLFQERAQSKGLDIATRIAFDLPKHFEADPVRLNQVLGNLVNNALKFTETGSVMLLVDRDPHREHHIRFSVRDTGIGIAADKIGSIFGAFSQADQTTTRRFGGTGLGLTISRKLVMAMGSDIEVTSELGRGSTFSFSIECAADAAASGAKRMIPAGRAVIACHGDATRAAASYYLGWRGFEVAFLRPGEPLPTMSPGDLVLADLDSLSQIDVAAARASGSRIVALSKPGDIRAGGFLDDGRADALLMLPLARRDIVHLLDRMAEGLPLAQHDERREQRVEHAQYGHARVLVVDDSPVNLEVAGEALRQFGIECDTAPGGLEAVEASGRNYDLILMDVSMPVIDGFEAARRIRAQEEALGLRRVPIVALTAHVVGAGANAWRDAGMDGVLHKPFTVAALGKTLAGLIAAAPASQAEAGVAAAEPAPAESVPADAEPTAVAAPQDATPVIDPGTFDELMKLAANGRSDFVQRVVRLYQDNGPAAAQRMVEARRTGDFDELARHAHALKSMSLNIGARRAALAAARIESSVRLEGRQPDMADVAAMPDLVVEACDALALRSRAAA